jgi:hypothetical protein
VDFEHGLNVAVNKLRQALADTAENPRYIETFPGQGYRFIAPVEIVKQPESANESVSRLRQTLRPLQMLVAGSAVLLFGVMIGWLIRPQPVAVASPVQFTVPLPPDLFWEPEFGVQDSAISPDGKQLAFVASNPAKSGLWIRP